MAKRPKGAARPVRRKAARKAGRTARKTAKRSNTRTRRAPAGTARKKPAARKKAPVRKKTTSRRKTAARKKTTARRPAAAKRRPASSAQAGRKRAATRKAAPAGAKKKTAAARKRSTARKAPAAPRKLPHLDRERRILREEPEEHNAPSSLHYEHHASGIDTGRAEMEERRHQHHESDPRLTGGDVDARWEEAYFSGDEAPGGDNPTPDQDVVEEIGRSIGLEYQDNEEMHDKVTDRDKHRWELDPASSEDYRDRGKK